MKSAYLAFVDEYHEGAYMEHGDNRVFVGQGAMNRAEEYAEQWNDNNQYDRSRGLMMIVLEIPIEE